MNILSRCRIIPRTKPSFISGNFSALANAQPGDSPGEQTDVSPDGNASQVSNFHEILQLCARNGTAMVAKACHGRTIRLELWQDITAWNVIINAYSKCGLVGVARQLFDGMPQKTMVSWNTMISLFVRNKRELEALKFFVAMRNEGVTFNEFTISSLLCACGARCEALECKQLHGLSVKTCLDSNAFVGTALLDLYAKCGLINDAVEVFESMQERSSVTWSSMIAAYVHNNFYEEALLLFRRVQRTSLEQNQFSISSVICACANLAALIEGKQIHAMSCKTGFDSNAFVASSLMDMYSKCGSVRDSYVIFSQVQEKNIVLWNAMISGFAKHARPAEVMILFEKMQQNGILPDEVTFSSLLSACGHMGLVKKGQRFFKLMKTEYNLSPNVRHYSCMVDILGRAGQLSEAYELIQSMPFDPTASIWGSLLASCRVYRNLKLAEIVAKKLFELEPENAGNHVLLSNIYAANEQWHEVAESRKLLRDSDVKKIRGKSWIEIKDKVHTFNVGDRHHPRMSEIQAQLDELLNDMKRFGYELGVEHELHDVEKSKKEELLRQHSEKLAFVFGLMCLPAGSEVRIMKNLRICVDCHEFMKVASMATRREIIVRDVKRFHHFSDGHCSCGEFW